MLVAVQMTTVVMINRVMQHLIKERNRKIKRNELTITCLRYVSKYDNFVIYR